MSGEIELEIDENGVARLRKQNPSVEIEFSSEDALIDWISTANNQNLFPEGVRLAFNNIESEDFLDGLKSKIDK